MIGGGHVRRLLVGSIINGSPCARVEKDKRVHAGIKGISLADHLAALNGTAEEPILPPIIKKASFASTSSFKFGDGRMDQAHKGSLKRGSLEFGCLSADGEDTSALCKFRSFLKLYHCTDHKM
jgi:serine/arginine repetitive matrix protein 2